ncbi:MAG: glutamate formimidoyltransferase [Candidatus Alcyoniella australis]|nr:glutamate formimidoyltransferase [Candidatus Alcyoniella australis]
MKELVECVPNFSEGRDEATIEAIVGAVRAVPGVKVLSAESDADYNRTVLTFVGSPRAVSQGALACARACFEQIDMSEHHGGHPRLGALDVLPFVPVRGIDINGAAALARAAAVSIADQLDVPVYLYGAAAARPEFANLTKARKGQYEALAQRLADPQQRPDFGPARFVPRFGAALVGARPFLIAYNVNLNCDDEELANEIARRVRTSGYKREGERVPGMLPEVKGMGVLLETQGLAQVSMNLTDFRCTSMHKAFDTVRELARERGADADGSELVGLAPLQALLDTAIHAGGSADEDQRRAVARAVEYLGLDRLGPFDPDKKVLELMLEDR